MGVSGRLQGKVAAVTGSGQGIGRAIAIAMAREGARLIVNNRSPNTTGGTAGDVMKEIQAAGGEAVAVFSDVGTADGGRAVVQAAVERFGRIDILVNNAGVSRPGMVWNVTEEAWDALMAIHLKGHFNCTRVAARYMREQRSGRIINICSRSGLYGRAGNTAYGTAKGGIAAFTAAVAEELAKYGVTVNAVCPSADTQMGPRATPIGEAPPRPAYTAGRDQQVRDPMDVTPLVVLLASEEGAAIHNQMFYIGGGEVEIIAPPRLVKGIEKVGGQWTVDDLVSIWPSTLGLDLHNPAPPTRA